MPPCSINTSNTGEKCAQNIGCTFSFTGWKQQQTRQVRACTGMGVEEARRRDIDLPTN
jgi:hypothetical protein